MLKRYEITAPNSKFTGVSACVNFSNGIAYINNERSVEWFKKRGYKVAEIGTSEEEIKEIEDGKSQEAEKELTEAKLKKMNSAELDELGVELSVDLSECQNKAEKVDKIWEAYQNKGE